MVQHTGAPQRSLSVHEHAITVMPLELLSQAKPCLDACRASLSLEAHVCQERSCSRRDQG